MNSIYRGFVITSLLMFGGCSEDVNSNEVETETIWAGIYVEAKSNNSTKVTVELNRRTFDGDNLILVNNDQLTATANGITQVLVEENELFDVDYETRFDFNVSDQVVQISLARPSTGTSAPNSTVRMPTSFNLLQPFNGTSYTSNDLVVTNWSNTRNGAEIRLSYLLSCTSLSNGSLNSANTITVTDDGYYEYDLSAHSMFDNPELDRSRRCRLDVTAGRRINGTLDPVYRSGQISGTQSRTIEGLSVQALP